MAKLFERLVAIAVASLVLAAALAFAEPPARNAEPVLAELRTAAR